MFGVLTDLLVVLAGLSIMLVAACCATVTRRLRRSGRIICRDEALADLIIMALAQGGWLTIAALAGWSLVLSIPVAACFTWRDWQNWRRHRHHDEDCKYGHRRAPLALKARLRTWRKVAVRPAFQPA